MASLVKRIAAAVTAAAMLNGCVTPAAHQGQTAASGPTATQKASLPEGRLTDVDIGSEIDVGYRPDPATDEGGWWMRMDRVEEALRYNASVIRDPALNDYVRSVVCKLGPDYCGDMRIYIVRHPGFNASMAPNGVMQVWSGLLLRAKDEAQLATVLGHEMAHYYKIHSIKNWRAHRMTADVLAFLSLGTAAFGVGFVGVGASVVALGGLSGYSRDNEREADAVGHMLMFEAGYDPQAAPELWRRVEREDAAATEKKARGSFYATHPASDEREKVLAARSELLAERDEAARFRGAGALQQAIAPFRREFLADEMAEGDYGRFLELLAMLEEDGSTLTEVHFFRGEAYRKRGEDGDLEKAREAYAQALVMTGTQPPAEVHKSYGLVALKLKDKALAREQLRLYLEKAPDSPDRGFVQQIIDQID